MGEPAEKSEPEKKDRKAIFSDLSESISNVGVRHKDGTPLTEKEQTEQADAFAKASEQVKSSTTELLGDVANEAQADLENAMPSTPNISAAVSTPNNKTDSTNPSSTTPNEGDGMARTGPDGKPAEGSDDLNALKLVGEVEEVPLDEVMDEINSLIGMDPFKEWISDLSEGEGFNDLADLMGFNDPNSEIYQKLNPNGKKKKKENDTFYHMVLTGNPGTGKSMTAEKYCQYLRSSGIMAGAKFYKISAGDIVSQYIGATANELKKILRQGKENNTPLILHLDEAYSLTSNKHGEEALDELVNAMTEEANRIVLVLSGYLGPMMEMLDKNPGMRSRIRIEIHCPDYGDIELIDIMKLQRQGQAIVRSISDAAKEESMKLFARKREIMGEKFGNGRVPEVLLQDMELAQKKRISRKYASLSTQEKLAQQDEIIQDMITYDVEDVKSTAAYRAAFSDQPEIAAQPAPSQNLDPK